MYCPKCKDITLKTSVEKSKNITLDRCPSCQGIWFDDKELQGILGPRAEKILAIPASARRIDDILCPRCQTGLYEFVYPGTMTMVDACKTCNGIWLDNMEWKEIKTARAAGSQTTCPKCGTRQPKSDACINCGIVFVKYLPDAGPDDTDNQPFESATPAVKAVISRNKDLDDIPGVKGQLLRFIDNAIERLTDY